MTDDQTTKPFPEPLGFLPYMLSKSDPRPAAEQFNERYAHGGGWLPAKGFNMHKDHVLKFYRGGKPLKPVAEAQLRNERIFLYPDAWVAIVQQDGTFEVSRMD